MFLEGQGFKIQPVSAGDTDAILAVYQQCEDFLALGPNPRASLAMVEADLALSEQEGGVFCGVRDPISGVWMGVVDVIPEGYLGEPRHAYLELLMIAQPYRGCGLGEAVVRAVEHELIHERQVEVIHLGCQVNNPVGLRFWQRMGYRIITEPTLMEDGTTAVQMKKEAGEDNISTFS